MTAIIIILAIIMIFGISSIFLGHIDNDDVWIFIGIGTIIFSSITLGSNINNKEKYRKEGAKMYYNGEYKTKVTYEIVNDSLVPIDTIIVKCKN